MYDSAGLQVLSREECLRLLGASAVGRLVYTNQALPVVHPVVYVLDGESVVLRVPDGSAALVARDTIAAFQIDDVAGDLSRGWSVTGIGHVTEAEDEVLLGRFRELPLPTRNHGDHDHYLVVALEVLSGRRIP
ncbi:pyridoxamine 5'-phosphate oxidase family protein [Saccharothrix syringae]|uniref:Pyridoxamine 5'-phosphate oxidase family protein n=1 Tax=Saccharothrix syringae TaxID=103733 RepID=A0A5Q0H9L9_SACSY|nr:pyridoxamine 5'-phosphate oxidase family protein [Saccharothrix syringae]QFZ22936.1 pyridoxamine 5'-phosphate oxidase family protein [Saccharothrix syringae]